MEFLSSQSSCQRPTSVMTILTDQMQSSCINDKEEFGTFLPIDANYTTSEDEMANPSILLSSSAPSNRQSFVNNGLSHLSGNINQLFNCITEEESISPHLPPKRKCHSVSDNNLRRPIAIKPKSIHELTDLELLNYQMPKHHSVNSMMAIQTSHTCKYISPCLTSQYNGISNHSNRTIISPHYKKSAFSSPTISTSITPSSSIQVVPVVPTTVSPHNSSSDYSVSPLDMDLSPLHRPASVTSSGFHDSSQQSLLYNYSPDCSPLNQCCVVSMALCNYCTTTGSNDGGEEVDCVTTDISAQHQHKKQQHHLPLQMRCHSQPSDEISRCFYTNQNHYKQHNQHNHHHHHHHQHQKHQNQHYQQQQHQQHQQHHHHCRQSNHKIPNTTKPTTGQRSNTQSRCKRRYPSIKVLDSRVQILGQNCCCQIQNGGTVSSTKSTDKMLPRSHNVISACSADNSPSACAPPLTVTGNANNTNNLRRDCYFFGNNRNYFVSLPRIASSPPPPPSLSDQICSETTNDDDNNNISISSNSSISNQYFNNDDVDMSNENPFDPADQLYCNSDDMLSTTSSLSLSREPGDPPKLMNVNNVNYNDDEDDDDEDDDDVECDENEGTIRRIFRTNEYNKHVNNAGEADGDEDDDDDDDDDDKEDDNNALVHGVMSSNDEENDNESSFQPLDIDEIEHN